MHICGEGGEYETLCLDCPLFVRRLVLDETEIILHSDDFDAPVALLRTKKWHTEPKAGAEAEGTAEGTAAGVADGVLVRRSRPPTTIVKATSTTTTTTATIEARRHCGGGGQGAGAAEHRARRPLQAARITTGRARRTRKTTTT